MKKLLLIILTMHCLTTLTSEPPRKQKPPRPLLPAQCLQKRNHTKEEIDEFHKRMFSQHNITTMQPKLDITKNMSIEQTLTTSVQTVSTFNSKKNNNLDQELLPQNDTTIECCCCYKCYKDIFYKKKS